MIMAAFFIGNCNKVYSPERTIEGSLNKIIIRSLSSQCFRIFEF